MKGQSPIRTVRDLMAYLGACPPDAQVCLMPNEGDGFPIGGVLQLTGNTPQEVWILIDEFGDEETLDDSIVYQGITDDDEDVAWDAAAYASAQRVSAVEKEDVIKIRGKLRSA